MRKFTSKQKQTGFTLIEMLMVVAIIGMLALNVMIILGGTREKTRIAASLRLSSSIAHGLEPLGSWVFDDGGVYDGSGMNNHGSSQDDDVSNGDSNTPALSVTGISGKALSFDGIDDFVELPSINPREQITVEAWVKSASSSTYGGIWQVISKYPVYILGSYSAGPRTMCFIVHSTPAGAPSDSNWRYGTCYEPPDITQWHHFVGTYNSTSGETRIYSDGVLKELNTPFTYDSNFFNPVNLPAPIDNDSESLELGHRECEHATPPALPCSSGMFFKGLIDDVRIYDRALSSAEIQKRYAEGLPIHQLVKK